MRRKLRINAEFNKIVSGKYQKWWDSNPRGINLLQNSIHSIQPSLQKWINKNLKTPENNQVSFILSKELSSWIIFETPVVHIRRWLINSAWQNNHIYVVSTCFLSLTRLTKIFRKKQNYVNSYREAPFEWKRARKIDKNKNHIFVLILSRQDLKIYQVAVWIYILLQL